MNHLFEDKKHLILLAIILFLLLALLYFYWVRPVKEEVATTLQQVEQLETTIEQLEEGLEYPGETADFDSEVYQLTKKLPLNRQLDEFLLSLQEIEIISRSHIEYIFFNNYEGALSEEDQMEQEESSGENEELLDEDMGESGEVEGHEEPPVSEVVRQLPENVRLITLQLDVVSPNFEQSQIFLQELEKLERLVRVDSLSFDKPGERELLEAEEEEIPIYMSVTITTFYFVQ